MTMPPLDTDFSTSPGETVSPTAAPHPSFNPSNSHSPSDSASANAVRTTPPANGTNGASGLNSRSCITCRKRKVRCDKRHPCSNCNRAAIECVFPGPGRAPRRSRKPENQELLARLRRLEGVVQKFQKGVDENGMTIIENVEAENTSPQGASPKEPDKIKQERHSLPGIYENWKSDLKDEAIHPDGTAGVTKEFGRLVVEDGRSRYVSNKFWSSLSEEVMEMRDILDDPTDDEDDYPSPGSGSDATANQQGFIFSFCSTVLSLRNFHPPRAQIPLYWDIYKSNVDPIVKVLHIPYHQKMFYKAAQDLDNVSKPMEVFMLTVYYCVVTSLSPNDCMVRLGLEKQQALRKYRFATEQALARTGFLNTQEFIVLQAMVLFLTCARRSDDTRYVWTVLGLLIRLAQAQGCHRDGQQFGLSPFETEMRRRLWWQACTLDVRASEDHGSDPTIMEQNFDTKLPLNINDEDISPEMTQTPVEHEGATEMTFDLIRFSVSTTVRRMSYAPLGQGPCQTKMSNLTLEDKEKQIDDLHQHLEHRYLQYLDMSVPLHWVAALVARLIMAKMWLVVHHPLSRIDRGAGLSQEVKDRLFHTSVEVIEFSRLLETDKSTLKWGWLFRTYVQWHALAFVLSELCIRTTGPTVDKAWAVIENALADEETHISSSQRGMLWKPLRKLLVKAKAERSKGLQNQSRFPLDGSIGPNYSSLGIPPGPMSTMDGITDFVAFDTSSSIDGFPVMMTSQPMNVNGLDQQQYIQIDQMQSNAMIDPASFLSDPAIFGPDRPIMDENMNWTGWEDMMKDYQMDGTNGQGGMPKDGMFNWM